MSNIVIVDGDQLVFEKIFGAYTVIPIGATLINASGEASINNKKICILGDEKKVSIKAAYTSPGFPISGDGTITIAALAPDQQAPFATATTPVIVVGSRFTALFTPGKPAGNAQSGLEPAPVPSTGSGQFTHSQSFVTAG